MSGFYPLFLNIKDRHCLVVGGGEVAERKIADLLDDDAKVHVISPETTETISELAKTGKITYEARDYREGDVRKSHTLVFATTDDHHKNQLVYGDAKKVRVPINVVDDPTLCDFYVPSVVSRGDLKIAVSTAGKSPALAKHIRKRLQDEFGPEYERWVDIVGKFRERVRSIIKEESERISAYEKLLESDIIDDVRAEKAIDIEDLVTRFAR